MVGGEDCGHVRESNCGFLRQGVVDCALEPEGRLCGVGGVFRSGICGWVAVGLVVNGGDFDCCVCRDLRKEACIDCGYVVSVEAPKSSRVSSHELYGVGISGFVA